MADPRMDNIERSINRIESTLVDLSQAMVSLARVEERLAASHETTSRMQTEINSLNAKLTHLSTTTAAQHSNLAAHGEKSRWIERIVWFSVVLAFGFVASQGEALMERRGTLTMPVIPHIHDKKND